MLVVFDLIAVVAVVVLLIAIMLAATRRDKFNRVVLILLAILGALLGLDWIAISAGFHDADGAFDCWPGCTTWQQAVLWTLTVGTVLAVALAVAVIFRENWRGRGGSR